MITGNKGDWSEIYALFKLLSDGQLFTGDGQLNRIEEFFFPIIKIIRSEAGVNFEYELKGNLVLIENNNEVFSIPIEEFRRNASTLLTKIRSEKGTFGDPDIEAFMNSYNSTTIKAKSTTKTDIRILIHDLRINQIADLGFSVKSELGNDSTILNAGDTTNIIYKIENYDFSDDEIKEINSINSKSKIKDRISKIIDKGAKINFYKINKDIFKNNLILIDSLMPNILSEIVFTYYTSKNNSIADLTEEIQKRNPIKYDLQHFHSFYEYKIKRLLIDVSLGMMPSIVWKGIYDATGGYLIVKENGDVLCYHIYNRNQFEDYLFLNTRLETGSSTRHKFGILYRDAVDNECYFKLNLQIRFTGK